MDEQLLPYTFGEKGEARPLALQVMIVDSHTGPYLQDHDPDIEREVLTPYATPILQRVHTAGELIGRIEDADAIISWHTIPLQAEIIARLRKCRGIVRAAVGF